MQVISLFGSHDAAKRLHLHLSAVTSSPTLLYRKKESSIPSKFAHFCIACTKSRIDVILGRRIATKILHQIFRRFDSDISPEPQDDGAQHEQ